MEALSGSLVAPRVLGAAEPTSSTAWIALEDLRQLDDRPWPLARFGTVARHLGAFNGAYLVEQTLPADPWLSRDWLRRWTGPAVPGLKHFPCVADHARVRQIFSDQQIAELLRFWDARPAFYDALDALPRTLCHRDIFPPNVCVRRTARGEQSVAIDWAFTGPGAIGEDLAPLVGASLTFCEADPTMAVELEQHCLDGYLDGLHAAGWHGARDDVRFGYLAALVLRYGVGALDIIATIALDETVARWLAQRMRRSADTTTKDREAMLRFLLPRIAEAQRLLAAR